MDEQQMLPDDAEYWENHPEDWEGELSESASEQQFESAEQSEVDSQGESSDESVTKLSLAGYTFDTLVGFDDEIERIREMGIVDGADSEYVQFVEQMKIQHGIPLESSGNTVLFRSAVRDDADRLMIATANELDRPTIRMQMIAGPAGMQALCIMSTPGLKEGAFDDWGTLVLEGVDTWGNPDSMMPAAAEGSPAMQGMVSGAMKAISVIRASIANPKVTVLVSAVDQIDPHSPLGMLLGPMTLFDIPAPSYEERDAIWNHLMTKHVSMSAMDSFELVEVTRGMPRCDIFAAAREAVVQAYRQSLEKRKYVPVTRANLLEKIGAYQPLDSAEYRFIEDSVVEDFLTDIERYERGEL